MAARFRLAEYIARRTDPGRVAVGALLTLREDAPLELRRSIDRQLRGWRAAVERDGAPLAPSLADQLRAYDAHLEIEASQHPPGAHGIAQLVERLERFLRGR